MAIEGIYFNENSLATNTAISGKGADELTMNDFINLMVAQMTNQDMLNPMSDTEFVAQMAQFSSLQGIQNIQEYQLASYATSYAGKYVTIAETTPFGELETINGKVEAVTFYDGSPKVQVNGKTYDLYKVMEVSDTASAGTLADAASYIGKEVTVYELNEFKEKVEHTGIVTGITIKDNVPHVTIDGKDYPVANITKVHNETSDEDDDDDDGEGNGTENSGVSPTNATVNYNTALGQEVARKLANGASTDPNDYTKAEILAYASTLVSKRGGSDVRTAAEIAQLIVDEGRM